MHAKDPKLIAADGVVTGCDLRRGFMGELLHPYRRAYLVRSSCRQNGRREPAIGFWTSALIGTCSHRWLGIPGCADKRSENHLRVVGKQGESALVIRRRLADRLDALRSARVTSPRGSTNSFCRPYGINPSALVATDVSDNGLATLEIVTRCVSSGTEPLARDGFCKGR